ncbi:MAG: YciI family protein [Chloroflexota bacterium]|nr:YciI family protein [Chloroflexota bacterium]
MRFMMIFKSNALAEAGVMPDDALLVAMGAYNEELIKAGVMITGEGLQASSKGARIRFTDGKPTVSEGPFPEPPERLVAGFWMIDVASKQEAIDWASRVPFAVDGSAAHNGGNGEIEIRQVFEEEDFVPHVTSDEAKAVLEAERKHRQGTGG